ncbi:hypothetical protein E2C01_004137 [Portunus trituberculatus]|uniref:Uncharacterized protein n=1 Tax=Portunus trituberculatus TaxID=210409 RepID=A0A5B7CPQ3_PORTR|nr:hypothetical protein [Portunus trituberculatus]
MYISSRGVFDLCLYCALPRPPRVAGHGVTGGRIAAGRESAELGGNKATVRDAPRCLSARRFLCHHVLREDTHTCTPAGLALRRTLSVRIREPCGTPPAVLLNAQASADSPVETVLKGNGN